MDPKMEEVFKIGGLPTHTFVEPQEYGRLLVAVRTPGRGVVVEGPSGIGKTTAVKKVIAQIGLDHSVTSLSARKQEEAELIPLIPEANHRGVIIIDDFHKLDDSVKQSIANYMKYLADEERGDLKLVIIGINKAGNSLISFADDLTNRMDIIRFENNPPEKIDQMLVQGERALEIQINVKDDIIEASQGAFYIAQLLAHEVCLKANILDCQITNLLTEVSFEETKAKIWERLGERFKERTILFCRGNRFRPEGRAPYLHLLNWLAMSKDWSISIDEAVRSNPDMKGSVTQIVEKGYLTDLIQGNVDISNVIHFDTPSGFLTIEDPQYIFYLQNIPWNSFVKRELSYRAAEFRHKYDFAMSFSGHNRAEAELIAEGLRSRGYEVFYDRFEQFRILAENIEDYLAPIYQSEARFVVCIFGKTYPERVWTRFEGEAFRSRFASGDVIPIFMPDAPRNNFDEISGRGGIEIGREATWPEEADRCVDLLIKKFEDSPEKIGSEESVG